MAETLWKDREGSAHTHDSLRWDQLYRAWKIEGNPQDSKSAQVMALLAAQLLFHERYSLERVQGSAPQTIAKLLWDLSPTAQIKRYLVDGSDRIRATGVTAREVMFTAKPIVKTLTPENWYNAFWTAQLSRVIRGNSLMLLVGDQEAVEVLPDQVMREVGGFMHTVRMTGKVSAVAENVEDLYLPGEFAPANYKPKWLKPDSHVLLTMQSVIYSDGITYSAWMYPLS